MNTIQQKLLPLAENIDYAIVDGELLPLPKTRMVPQIIHHEAIAEIRGEKMEESNGVFKMNKTAVLQAGVAAYDETVLVAEEYKEMLPSLESVKMSCIDDIALAISEFLADKQDLVDHENDSINIVNNTLHSFNFKNVPHPSNVELLDCYDRAVAKSNQAAINTEALKYLADTDYLVIREIDSGIACPEEIKQLRAEARLKIVR